MVALRQSHWKNGGENIFCQNLLSPPLGATFLVCHLFDLFTAVQVNVVCNVDPTSTADVVVFGHRKEGWRGAFIWHYLLTGNCIDPIEGLVHQKMKILQVVIYSSSLFLTKEDILTNVGNQTVDGPTQPFGTT